jgi:hypothetical protein
MMYVHQYTVCILGESERERGGERERDDICDICDICDILYAHTIYTMSSKL